MSVLQRAQANEKYVVCSVNIAHLLVISFLNGERRCCRIYLVSAASGLRLCKYGEANPAIDFVLLLHLFFNYRSAQLLH